MVKISRCNLCTAIQIIKIEKIKTKWQQRKSLMLFSLCILKLGLYGKIQEISHREAAKVKNVCVKITSLTIPSEFYCTERDFNMLSEQLKFKSYIYSHQSSCIVRLHQGDLHIHNHQWPSPTMLGKKSIMATNLSFRKL